MRNALRSALLLSTSFCFTNVAASAAGYTYEEISVPGALATIPVALSASGVVLGYWDDAEFNSHGFIYDAGTITSFDPTGAQSTYPTGINASGEVVGNYLDSSFAEADFTYSNGTFTTVTMPKSTATSLAGINDSGVLLGSAAVAGAQLVFADTNGKFKTIVSKNNPLPIAINASGSVAGYYEMQTGPSSFLYSGGVLKTLPITGVKSAIAYGMNDANSVVGAVTTTKNVARSFVYKGGKVTLFGVPGWTASYATAINNNGVIVGGVSNINGHSSGYVYNGTNFTFVSIAKATSQSATKINDAGQILGSYTDSTNVGKVFLATPKP